MAEASKRPWEKYILSPASRRPAPEKVHGYSGHVTLLEENGHDVNLGDEGLITLDFGREVGGLVSFDYRVIGSDGRPKTDPQPEDGLGATARISISFCESPLFIGKHSDDTGATPNMDWDQSYPVDLTGSGRYTLPNERFRGGFRFLTLVMEAGAVKIKDVRCEIGFAPDADDLREYSGYFLCDDDLLNRVWYAGAYTCQTNIAPNDTGRHLPHVRPGWRYDAPLGAGPPGAPVLVDGAKRDRAVWPGDLGVAIPSTLLAFGPKLGWPAVRNALLTLFESQHADGMMPFAGPSTMSHLNASKSQAYHYWSLIALGIVHGWGGVAPEFVEDHYDAIEKAVRVSLESIGPNGLIWLEHCHDWAREESPGFKATVNALAYGAFTVLAHVAEACGRESTGMRQGAARIRDALDSLLWDDAAGLYREAPHHTMHPQDANVYAVIFGLASPSRAARISASLQARWNDIGPLCPELPDTISPFISGLEVHAHFLAGRAEVGVALMRRTWGYMLDAAHMGGTTLVEGMTAHGGLNYRGNAGYNNDPSYCSLSHSWSSGPTSALTYHLLGLNHTPPSLPNDDPASSPIPTWSFLPRPGTDVRQARGGFITYDGEFSAAWELDQRAEVFKAEFVIPMTLGTGVVGVPTCVGDVQEIRLNGTHTLEASVRAAA